MAVWFSEKKVGFHVVMRPASMSLGLTYGGFGPFGVDQVLKYGHVITNVGDNYSPLTGQIWLYHFFLKSFFLKMLVSFGRDL